MNPKKIIISLIITGLGILVQYFFWKDLFLIILVLCGLVYIKHKIIPLKKEWLMFVVSGLLGTAGESIIMLSGAWSYSQPHILNFPLWLPFLWGLAGVTGISLYQGMVEAVDS